MSPHPHDRPRIFRITAVGGVWRVSNNGAFLGDFGSRDGAVEAAGVEARKSEALGHPAEILTLPGEAPLPHGQARLDA